MKNRITRADENAIRQLFQNSGKVEFFLGAARISGKGSTLAWGNIPDEQVAELLVTLEFDMTKQYPSVEELSKNAGILGQITEPFCNIIGCNGPPVKTIEIEGKLISFCRKHMEQLKTALG